VNIERWIRVIAGTFVLASLVLGVYVNRYFLLFTAFVGLNLFQSGLTRWCLMEDILRKLGVPEGEGRVRESGTARRVRRAG
jgi:hypothetical protein